MRKRRDQDCVRVFGDAVARFEGMADLQRNTDVGKTVISTILCKALQRRAPNGSAIPKACLNGTIR